MLAFKNDIGFWKNNKSMRGLSGAPRGGAGRGGRAGQARGAGRRPVHGPTRSTGAGGTLGQALRCDPPLDADVPSAVSLPLYPAARPILVNAEPSPLAPPAPAPHRHLRPLPLYPAARSILVNAGCQLVIFLYLLDNETSAVVLLSTGVGCAIEFWKVGARAPGGSGWRGRGGAGTRAAAACVGSLMGAPARLRTAPRSTRASPPTHAAAGHQGHEGQGGPHRAGPALAVL